MHDNNPDRRLAREKRTLECMIVIYCRATHGAADDICADCRELLEYALDRLDSCGQGPDKPTCAQCVVHCFNPAMRQRVRAVMRYAGPRMFLHHPGLALGHVFDKFRRPRRG